MRDTAILTTRDGHYVATVEILPSLLDPYGVVAWGVRVFVFDEAATTRRSDTQLVYRETMMVTALKTLDDDRKDPMTADKMQLFNMARKNGER